MHFLCHRAGTRGEEDGGVVIGCEAFLSGSWWAECQRHDGFVPPWVWVNLLAHCPNDQLDQRVATVANIRWRQALAYLVCELRAAGKEQGTTVHDLQRSALVPLELRVMDTRPWAAKSPSALVIAVTGALREDTVSSRRRHRESFAPEEDGDTQPRANT